jgi:hypothetical protein
LPRGNDVNGKRSETDQKWQNSFHGREHRYKEEYETNTNNGTDERLFPFLLVLATTRKGNT